MGVLRGLGRAVGGLLAGVFGLLRGLLQGVGSLLRRLSESGAMTGSGARSRIVRPAEALEALFPVARECPGDVRLPRAVQTGCDFGLQRPVDPAPARIYVDPRVRRRLRARPKPHGYSRAGGP